MAKSEYYLPFEAAPVLEEALKDRRYGYIEFKRAFEFWEGYYIMTLICEFLYIYAEIYKMHAKGLII